jgi:hypothetical protein
LDWGAALASLEGASPISFLGVWSPSKLSLHGNVKEFFAGLESLSSGVNV